MMENKDKVITILLERISDLEFEVERLNNIIKEIREYIDRRDIEWGSDEHNHLLEILDKENKE